MLVNILVWQHFLHITLVKTMILYYKVCTCVCIIYYDSFIAPTPELTINYNTGVVYENSSLVFTCNISSVFPGAVVNISWYEGDTLLQTNDIIRISDTVKLNDTVYSSVLNVTSLSLSMNSTVYTCSYSVGTDGSLAQYVTAAVGNISTSPLRVHGM